METLEHDPKTEAGRVTVERVDVFPVKLPITQTFLFATGSPGRAGEKSSHVFVRITDSDGCYGWGEARPVRGWSGETAETVVTTLRRYVAPALTGHEVHDVRGLHSLLDRVIGRGSSGQPIARCGIDVAFHDLLSRRAGLPLRALLGGSRDSVSLPLSYTLIATDIERIEEEIAQAHKAGFKHVNFKTGVNRAADVDIPGKLRELIGPDAFLWADANQSLVPAEGANLLRRLEEAEVDLFEQPLPTDARHAFAHLRRNTDLSLGIDEASVSAGEYFNYVAAGLVDFLIIKLTRSGGIFPTMSQVAVAQAAGQSIIASGLIDSLLTRMATAQVVAALRNPHPMALNGGQFLDESDLFPGIDSVEADGHIRVGDQPGIGVEPDLDAIRAFEFGSEL